MNENNKKDTRQAVSSLVYSMQKSMSDDDIRDFIIKSIDCAFDDIMSNPFMGEDDQEVTKNEAIRS